MKYVWFFLCLGSFSYALDFSARYHSSSTYVNSLDLTGIGSAPVSPQFDIRIGVRGGFSRLGIEKIEGILEGSWAPLSFVRLVARANSAAYLDEVANTLVGLAYAELRTPEFIQDSHLYVRGGWYRRFVFFNKIVLFPSFENVLSEHDFALGIGGQFRLTQEWQLTAEAATFETLSVYNLNHPFGEVSVLYSPEEKPWAVRAFFRYQIILGFGRVGDVSMGVGVRVF